VITKLSLLHFLYAGKRGRKVPNKLKDAESPKPKKSKNEPAKAAIVVGNNTRPMTVGLDD
jgi:hypothetical protein